MIRWQVVRLLARDMFGNPDMWQVVGEYDNYEDGYSHQMAARDDGETVELRQWMAG
jgi:hypothetical protein